MNCSSLSTLLISSQVFAADEILGFPSEEDLMAVDVPNRSWAFSKSASITAFSKRFFRSSSAVIASMLIEEGFLSVVVAVAVAVDLVEVLRVKEEKKSSSN